ncbi:chemotaxis protein CheW [Desulforhopalus sp. IMCC35007]|uniref:chemotaxis protein CheW n=1 Tax=Desulforhopalus sp. IMCC35007 TaxID=2569543 RepID=UPI0010AED4B5|nr:chemotaxis protein CheW [Desulforhopalus sp. IMCC35007]TKB09873.1 chemotaxis protein CheW [Desulforhopalus sp. IMCC35007]
MTKYPDLIDLIHAIDRQLEGAVGGADRSVFGATAPEVMVKYILVKVGTRTLAIGIDSLAEVGVLPKITALPNLPWWILGIMNIRSEIISMVDFTGFLQERQPVRNHASKLVVLRNDKVKVGIGVDAIVGTVNIVVQEILPNVNGDAESIEKMLFPSRLLSNGVAYSILDVGKFLTHPRLIDFDVKRSS